MKVHAQKIEHIPVSDLHFHPRNPRVGNVPAIAESIKENGFTAPLIVQRSTMQVLAGNHRLKAACSLGMDAVPVVFVDCDDGRALKILLADNRSSDLGENDPTQLAVLLQDVAEAGSLLGTCYSADDLASMLVTAERPQSPGEFTEFDEDIDTEHKCPKCGYAWSGKAK